MDWKVQKSIVFYTNEIAVIFLIYFIACCEDSENLGKIPQPILENT